MPDTFKAFVVDKQDDRYDASIRDLRLADLPDEPVLVDVAYSSLNYKDGLAVTGKIGVVRSFPMVCGIDLAGTIVESAHPAFAPGARVLVNGWGLSENHWGGYSQKQRVKAEFLTRLPPEFSFMDAMAIGTAGYTAMLCVMALEQAGVTPAAGDIVVTGAAGGVGSVAVVLLAKLGYRVVASSGRRETHDYLKNLGAAEVIGRDELNRDTKPLGRARWGGGVDTVGSKILSAVLAQIKDEGAVAACGLAAGTDLPTTVMPFILRGIMLLGVNSVTCPAARRDCAWARLADDLDMAKLKAITAVESMHRLPELGEQILKGQVRGRVVIDPNC